MPHWVKNLWHRCHSANGVNNGTFRQDIKVLLLLRVADLVLNRHAREVRRGGETIDLTLKEFTLLECLMRTPGKVLNRARILEHVWGYSVDPMTNIVDVYIRQLRCKIDERHEQKLLKTVRGVGYKVDVS